MRLWRLVVVLFLLAIPLSLLVARGVGESQPSADDPDDIAELNRRLAEAIASPTTFPPNTCGKLSSGELLPCELTGEDFARAVELALNHPQVKAALAGKLPGPDGQVFPAGYSVLRVDPVYPDEKESSLAICDQWVPPACGLVILYDSLTTHTFRVLVNIPQGQVLNVSVEAPQVVR